jgi:DNA-directed RNA polymerase specialized sigma24 family protein
MTAATMRPRRDRRLRRMSGAAPPETTAERESPVESVVGGVGLAGSVRQGRGVDRPGAVPAGLLELTGPEREVLVLRLVVGLSAEQTARVLGCSAMSVWVAQHRALDRLRDLLRRQDETVDAQRFR